MENAHKKGRGAAPALWSKPTGDTATSMKMGDWVEVKTPAEILCTLDTQGALDGMPFMPEMLEFCGRRFQIRKSAHKTCESMTHKARYLKDVVHLDTRCSGTAHGGCMAGCLLFWKKAWLRSVDGPASQEIPAEDCAKTEATPKPGEMIARMLSNYCVIANNGVVRYSCQATHIREASNPLRWWDMRQYVRDLRSGNLTLGELACGTTHAFWMAMIRLLPRSRLVRSCYEHLRFLWRGSAFPRRMGTIPCGERTPVSNLNLRAGELVRVRSISEIDHTLDCAGKNRGLYFDPEQIPYTNRTFRVLRQVERIINEDTGEMLPMKTPSVVLESVVCRGQYGRCRMFCPRSAYLLWREAWLERAESCTPQFKEEER